MPLFASLMAAGSLSGALISPSKFFAVLAWIIFFISASAAFAFSKWKKEFVTASVCMALFAAGFSLASARLLQVAGMSPAPGGERIEACGGAVSAPPDVKKWGGYVDVNLSGCRSGKARLSIGPDDTDLKPGDGIIFRAKFYSPREYKNPGVFSWRDYLAVHGIGVQGRVYGRVERTGGGSFILGGIETLRRRIADSAAKNIALPERGIVLALANGDQSLVTRNMRDTFANTGLAHLIAISGMNVAYVAALVYFAAKFIFGFFPWLIVRVPVRRLAAVVTLPAVFFYVLLTGSAISAVRAAIMLAVFLTGVLIGRRQDLLTTLAVSVMVIIFFLPLSVLDVSFQLSVAAVAGIILMTPLFVRLFGGEGDRATRRGRALLWMRSLAAVSVAAGVSTMPLVAYHFKFVSVVGFVANLIAVPLTGALLTPVVAAASAVSIFAPSAAAILWKASGAASWLFLEFAEITARAGGALVVRWAPSAPDVALFYAAIVLVIFWKGLKYKKIAVVSVAAAIFLNVGCEFVAKKFDTNLKITVLDVGQGDSSVIRFADGRVMLIDGGGIRDSEFDVGRNVVAPALMKMGISRLDWVVLSHPHHDHFGGLGFVVSEFGPGSVFTNGFLPPPDEEGAFDDFKEKVNQSGAKYFEVKDSDFSMEVGGARVRILRPLVTGAGRLNDTSLVTEIRYGEHSFLFTGDLSWRGEGLLISELGDAPVAFLKAGHHGSKDASSVEFLAALRPKIAAISAGERNQYGFPAGETLARLEKAGARILRTDTDGAITIESDGKNISADVFVRRD